MVQEVRGIHPQRKLLAFADSEALAQVGVKVIHAPALNMAGSERSKLPRFRIHQAQNVRLSGGSGQSSRSSCGDDDTERIERAGPCKSRAPRGRRLTDQAGIEALRIANREA